MVKIISLVKNEKGIIASSSIYAFSKDNGYKSTITIKPFTGTIALPEAPYLDIAKVTSED